MSRLKTRDAEQHIMSVGGYNIFQQTESDDEPCSSM